MGKYVIILNRVQKDLLRDFIDQAWRDDAKELF